MMPDIEELHARITALEHRERGCEKLAEERDRRYSERADAQDRAVMIAQSNLEKRLDSLNELRAVVTDQQKTFARSSEVSMEMKSVLDRINGLADMVHAQINRGTGIREVIGWLVGASGIAIAIAVHLFK